MMGMLKRATRQGAVLLVSVAVLLVTPLHSGAASTREKRASRWTLFDQGVMSGEHFDIYQKEREGHGSCYGLDVQSQEPLLEGERFDLEGCAGRVPLSKVSRDSISQLVFRTHSPTSAFLGILPRKGWSIEGVFEDGSVLRAVAGPKGVFAFLYPNTSQPSTFRVLDKEARIRATCEFSVEDLLVDCSPLKDPDSAVVVSRPNGPASELPAT